MRKTYIHWTIATTFSVLAILSLIATSAFPITKTLVDTDSTQTLTNKTLATPTITSPTITGNVEGGASYSNIALTGTTGPLQGLGDTLYGAANGAITKLAGSITATTKSYFQRGTGAVSAAPAWLPLTGDLHNVGLAVSVAANAMTIALKGEDGSDPSTANPVSVKIRSSTLATGTPVWMTRVSALSLVVPSGAELGLVTNQRTRLWLYASATDVTTFDSICIFNTQGAGGILYPAPIEGAVYSGLTIGTGSDSANTLYCTTGTTNMPLVTLGYLEITQATPGTWASGVIVTKVMAPGVPRSGAIIQSLLSPSGAVATGTTTIPNDDTIPQNTEGDQYMSLAIVPTSSVNILRIRHIGLYSSNAASVFSVALFQDTTANALASIEDTGPALTAANLFTLPLSYRMAAGTTASTTFKIRAGASGAGTTTFNGSAGARLHGGVLSSVLEIEEIFP